MRKFQCRICGGKQYSTARLREHKHPECIHCGAPASQIFETDATRDKTSEPLVAEPLTISEMVNVAATSGAPTIDQAMIAAHIVQQYCLNQNCSAEEICPLGRMLSCYCNMSTNVAEADFVVSTMTALPLGWDIPNPVEIGLCKEDKGGEDDETRTN